MYIGLQYSYSTVHTGYNLNCSIDKRITLLYTFLGIITIVASVITVLFSYFSSEQRRRRLRKPAPYYYSQSFLPLFSISLSPHLYIMSSAHLVMLHLFLHIVTFSPSVSSVPHVLNYTFVFFHFYCFYTLPLHLFPSLSISISPSLNL